MRAIVAGLAPLLLVGYVTAQDTTIQVREEDGGSVAVHAAGGILNQESSLRRRWYVLDDVSSPVRLERAGLFARFDEKESTHYLTPIGTASPKQAISAVEVRYLLFDVWGERLRAFSLTRLADSSTHVDLRISTRWPVLEQEVARWVTVVAFVARAKTVEGQLWTFDAEKVASRIGSLGLNVVVADLDSDELWPVNPGQIYWIRTTNNVGPPNASPMRK